MAETFEITPDNDPEEEDQEDGMDSEKDEAVEMESTPHFFWRAIVVIALVILFIIGILLPIKLVPTAVSGITSRVRNYFSDSKGVVVNKNLVRSGDAFTLGLNTETTDTNGTFTLFFPCREGVYLEYSKTGTSTDRETVSCETPFTFTSKNKAITFTAYSQRATSTVQPISIDYTPSPENGSTTEKTHLGDISLTITNPAPIGSNFAVGTTSQPVAINNPSNNPPTTTTSTYMPPTPEPSEPLQNPQPASQPAPTIGPADAKVTFTRLSPSGSVQSNGPLSVQFSIYNSGKAIPAGWTFDVYLPSQDQASQVYHSPRQTALGYQKGINNTLTVSNLAPGAQTITIILNIKDSNQANNKIAIPVTIY